MARGFLLTALRPLLFASILGVALPLFANNPFGTLVPIPNLTLPGVPIGELTVGGETYLLLRGETPSGDLEPRLWNPNETISLVLPATITTNALAGVTGMQTAQGPRVFLWGDFVIGGTATRMLEWDGTDWDLPGGAVGGIIPNDAAIRQTSAGAELWVGSNLSLFPGIATPSTLAVYDGTTWQLPGTVVGAVEQIDVLRESGRLEDTVLIAGAIISIDGTPVSTVARFDGAWDTLDGGVPGPITALSVFLDENGQLEIWATGDELGFIWAVSRYANGAWTDLPLNFLPAGTPLGRVQRLPTVFGDWRIFEGFGSLFLGPTIEFTQSFVHVAWNPATGLYRPTSTSSTGVFSFESPSGLLPSGNLSVSSTGEVSEWVTEIIEFLSGDTNFDGTVNLADAIVLLSDVFGSTTSPCPMVGDFNGDDETNIADAIYMIGWLFGDNQPPFGPTYPDCGFDPDRLIYDCDNPMPCP